MTERLAARPTGAVSARTVGTIRILRRRAERAREVAAAHPEPDSQFAAALRGKVRGYDEAADLVERLERGQRLNGRYDKRTTGGAT